MEVEQPLTFRSTLRFSKETVLEVTETRHFNFRHRLSGSWYWEALSFYHRVQSEEGAIRPRQTHHSCLSACHVGASVLHQKKMMARPETCNQQLVTLLVCSGGGTARSCGSGSGGDKMTIVYFDTQENVVIGEKMEAYCEEDPRPCLSHKYHFSATGKSA